MKGLLPLGGVAIVLGGIYIYSNYFAPMEYEANGNASAPEIVETVVETLPDWANDEDAIKAAQDVLRRKELEAELETLYSSRTGIDNRIVEIENELTSY